jgi:flagellar biosynthesis protein
MSPPREDPRRKAVALRYDALRDDAPKMIAKGSGVLADRILQIAKEHGIHVHSDPALVGLLAQLEPNQHIPETMYRAVAEVLALVYRLNQERRRNL